VSESKPGPGSITDVQGVRVGHYRDSHRPTGCTAILFDNEVSAGVDYDGSAPGEQLGVMLQPTSLLEGIHGILLAGGGPMGLAAVPGAVKYLDEHHIGYDWGVPNIRVPIVVRAVIDDLPIGDGRIRPDAEAGYKACQAASAGPVAEGNVGAGAGATVGKMLRAEGFPGMKGGLGTASLRLGEIVIGALAVVNASGDILDWRTRKLLAGARHRDGRGFAGLTETLKRRLAEHCFAQLAESFPDSWRLHQMKAEIYLSSEQHNPAIQEYQIALEKQPGNAGLHEALGGVFLKKKSLPKARVEIERALQLDPTASGTLYLEGALYLAERQSAEAIPYLQKAVRRDPSMLAAHAALGKAYLRTGNPQLAVPELEKSLALDHYGDLHFLLSQAYRQLGKNELAQQALARSQELRKDSAAADQAKLVGARENEDEGP